MDEDLNGLQVYIPLYKIHSWTISCWCDKGSNWYWPFGKETGWVDACRLKPERLWLHWLKACNYVGDHCGDLKKQAGSANMACYNQTVVVQPLAKHHTHWATKPNWGAVERTVSHPCCHLTASFPLDENILIFSFGWIHLLSFEFRSEWSTNWAFNDTGQQIFTDVMLLR